MRSFGLVLVLLVSLGAALFTWRHAEEMEPPPAPSASSPRYYVKQAQWHRLDEQGRLAMRARAERIEYFDDESAQLSRLEVDYLGGKDSPWRFSAPSGIAPPYERRMSLQGPVSGSGRWPEGDAFELHTDQLWLDQTRREIYTDSRVVLSSPTRAAAAQGLRADWDAKRVTLVGDVKVEYVPR